MWFAIDNRICRKAISVLKEGKRFDSAPRLQVTGHSHWCAHLKSIIHSRFRSIPPLQWRVLEQEKRKIDLALTVLYMKKTFASHAITLSNLPEDQWLGRCVHLILLSRGLWGGHCPLPLHKLCLNASAWLLWCEPVYEHEHEQEFLWFFCFLVFIFWGWQKRTTTYPGRPPDSMWLAKVTSCDHTSNCHLRRPITPHSTLPECTPTLMLISTPVASRTCLKKFHHNVKASVDNPLCSQIHNVPLKSYCCFSFKVNLHCHQLW